jgi:murein DD-endopeptidase MepM/ murein hydrolase activator NlpD
MKQQAKKWFSGLLAAVMVLSVVLAVPGALTVPVSAAVTREEINSLKENANSLASQKNELKQQLSAIAADKNKVLEQKNLLEQRINVIQEEIDNIAQQITKYDNLISVKTEELAENQKQEAKQNELFCQRVRMMEEEGEVSYWSILFNSSSFAELLDRFMMVEEIMEYDNAIMEQLLETRKQIEADKAELEAARKEQEAARKVQQAAKDELKTEENKVEGTLSEINAREDKLQEAHNRLQAAANAMDAEIRQKEKELEKQMASSGSTIVTESGFIWPLSRDKILTSFFGNRRHPITGKKHSHTGIDVSAAGGTPILSSKSGVVIKSTYNNSYGNYVVVSHGNGQTTLYAHMKSRAAKVGQSVKQGQTIGYVGSTGSSSGNHLHYEIRVNGVRQDPLDYYRGYKLYVLSGGRIYDYVVP